MIAYTEICFVLYFSTIVRLDKLINVYIFVC